MILTIAGKELRRLFTSPLAWVILAFLQLILAWIFLSRLQGFLELQPQIAMMPNAPGLTEIVVAPTFGSPFGRPGAGPGFGAGFGPGDDERPGPGPGGPVVRGDVVE